MSNSNDQQGWENLPEVPQGDSIEQPVTSSPVAETPAPSALGPIASAETKPTLIPIS